MGRRGLTPRDQPAFCRISKFANFSNASTIAE
jgi:hypothetical protein